MKYLVILTSPSHHLMDEPQDFFEPYIFNAASNNEFDYLVEKAERNFCKKYNIPLADISLLLTYKVK